MKNYKALREKPKVSPYKKGDALVLFGELFQRGYANGLVEAAEKAQMEIIYSTVGRRDRDGQLRALNQEELQEKNQNLINIPLEAGFDYEKNSQGESVLDLLKEIKLSDWESWKKPDHIKWSEFAEKGRERFRKQVKAYVAELEKKIKPGQNILFAHLMAGGVPRAKIVMPLMNRAFKGTEDRYLSSEKFWNSEIGQICQLSFKEVTAQTFNVLIEETTQLREKMQKQGSKVSYVAYGYHGTEILINGKFQWQTYTPYLQGFAKIELENVAKKFSQQGVSCCVYNCPEILTNSSSIFQGVEVSLYPLILALQNNPTSENKALIDDVKNLLIHPEKIDDIQKMTNEYFSNPIIKDHCQFEKWPQHSTKDQLSKMIETSECLFALHKDQKNLLTFPLSEKVFEACGYCMLHSSFVCSDPVLWLNHDLIAQC